MNDPKSVPILLLVGFFALALSATPACAQASGRPPRPGSGATRPASLKFGGLVISEFVTVPNASVGVAKGEFVELYNREDPRGLGHRDVSGWSLELFSGPSFVLPAGTVIPARGYLVIDFSDGTVAAEVRPEYRTPVVTAERSPGVSYRNDFFENPAADGHRDLLILRDGQGAIRDAVSWNRDPFGNPIRGGRMAEAVQAGEWKKGDVIYDTFDPALGDIGFARAGNNAEMGVDRDIADDWAQGNDAGPTPGTDHAWTGFEGNVGGKIWTPAGSPIPGAVVSIPALGKSVVTDVQGLFTISDVPPGSYDVRVQAQGFVTTWGPILDKNPHHALHFGFTLQRVDPATTVTATLGPAGGTLQEPNFSIEFPAGFLAGDTQVTATWIPGGLHSLGVGSRQLQVGPDHLLPILDAAGGLDVHPHLTSASGAAARVRLLFEDQDFTNAQPGSVVHAESIGDDGSVETLPDGTLVAVGGGLMTESLVTHFSSMNHFVPVHDRDGHKLSLRGGSFSADVDGDGDSDFHDAEVSIKNVHCEGGFCPLTAAQTIKLSATVTASRLSGDGTSNTTAISGGTGKLMSEIVQGKAGWKHKTTHHDSSQETFEVTYTEEKVFKYDLNPPVPLEPPDEEMICSIPVYHLMDVVKHGKKGRSVVAKIKVPVGFTFVKKVTGHCM